MELVERKVIGELVQCNFWLSIHKQIQDAGTNNRVKPKKTADISRRHRWFPGEVTSKKRAQKFHTDDLLRRRSGASDWMKQIFNQSEALHRIGYYTSSVWNFCARFLGVISRGNHRWRREMCVQVANILQGSMLGVELSNELTDRPCVHHSPSDFQYRDADL